MKEKAYEMTLLCDFFGEMLTEKQREYFDLYYNEDLSLGEIAENDGISRQAVRDAIVRAEKFLLQAEEKTGVLHRFLEQQAAADRLEQLARQMEQEKTGVQFAPKLREIAAQLRK